MENLEPLLVETEIVWRQQIEENAEVYFELFITEEKMVWEVDPYEVDNVEFLF